MVKLGFIRIRYRFILNISNLDKLNIKTDDIKLSLLHDSPNFSMFFCQIHRMHFFYSKKENTYKGLAGSEIKEYSKIISDDEIYYSMSKNPKIRDIFLKKYSNKIIFQKIFSFYKNIIDNKFVFNINDQYQSTLKLIDSSLSSTEKISICIDFYHEFCEDLNTSLKDEISSLSTIEKSTSEINLKLKIILNDIYKINDILFILNNFKMENIEDIIQKRLFNHRYKSLINNSISKKYKYLINDDSRLLFRLLINNNISIKEIKKEFIFKIAKYDNPDNFYYSLKKYYESKVDFSYDIILKKIKDNNVKHSLGDNTILAEIETFEQSQILGSSSWCISYDQYYFKQYKKKLNRIYFLFDFNVIKETQYTMIGVTIDSFGKIIFSYDKEDNCAMEYTAKNINFEFSPLSINEINKKITSIEDIEDNDLCSLFKEKYYNLLINDKEKKDTIITRLLFLFDRKKIDKDSGEWFIKQGCNDSVFDINHHDFFTFTLII